MNKKLEPKHYELWELYVNAWNQYKLAQKLLFTECGTDRDTLVIDLIKWALELNEKSEIEIFNRFAIYDAVKILTPEGQYQLIDYLWPLALETETKRAYNVVEKILLSLPKEWLLETAKQKVNQILSIDPSQINTGLIGFVMEIDKTMARQLAEIASSSSDEYQKDTGQYFLNLLGQELDTKDNKQ